jgi:hypothetical protein
MFGNPIAFDRSCCFSAPTQHHGLFDEPSFCKGKPVAREALPTQSCLMHRPGPQDRIPLATMAPSGCACPLVLHSPSASSLPIYLFYLPFMYFVGHALPALVRSRGFTVRAPSALETKGARSSLRGERGLSLWEMSLPPPYEHHHNIAFGHPPPLPAPRPHCLG